MERAAQPFSASRVSLNSCMPEGDGVFDLRRLGHSTTVNVLSDLDLERPLVTVPTAQVMKRFDEVVMPILRQAELNHQQSVSTAATRDRLLPRLRSGEVEVGAAVHE